MNASKIRESKKTDAKILILITILNRFTLRKRHLKLQRESNLLYSRRSFFHKVAREKPQFSYKELRLAE